LIFELKNKDFAIYVLDNVDYGTLAMCTKNIPYSVPINFVRIGNLICFHTGESGKKITFLKKNSVVSLSVVKEFSLIPSYFSSDDKIACKATQFFASVIIDGKITFVKDVYEKISILEGFMDKYQPEGKYDPFEKHREMVELTTVFTLIPKNLSLKLKFGQNLPEERFKKILNYLENRGTEKDMETIKMMNELRKKR